MGKQYRPEDLAAPETFLHDPELVWRFYHWRREFLSSCMPNPAHYALASMEQELDLFILITQNVDGLHQKAGSNQVIELHGSIWRLFCSTCGEKRQDFRVSLPRPFPLCELCSGIARPDVVWFGESLDVYTLEQARNWATSAKIMLVIGTSSLV